ncbi:MAG: Short-chain dehydrogenase [Acidimicrobiales bacterium]|nr:Short-chain dehydrogenase [Acidimicrobiales bacterium]
MLEPPFPLPYSSTDLTGRVALVTGASSGLGWRFARTLASAGASVVATARRGDKLNELAAVITATGGTCLPLTMDVTRADQLIETVGRAEDALGLVDILVNNAGIPDAQRAHKMSIELIDSVLDTNVRAPFILCCEVARRLIGAKRPGRIVNISSIGAFNYDGNGAALYSTSKASINRMTETLAMEWARFGINVNAIAPGSFSSEMMDGMIERIGDVTTQFPRRRLGDPAQLDSTLLYLVAPSSEFVTGTIIKVDDGQAPR